MVSLVSKENPICLIPALFSSGFPCPLFLGIFLGIIVHFCTEFRSLIRFRQCTKSYEKQNLQTHEIVQKTHEIVLLIFHNFKFSVL